MKEVNLIAKVSKRLLDLEGHIYDVLGGEPAKKSIRWMYFQDASDYIKYYRAIIAKNYKKAWDIQENMDTSPRDEIPEYIFDFVRKQVQGD